jgi:hypothetical protein
LDALLAPSVEKRDDVLASWMHRECEGHRSERNRRRDRIEPNAGRQLRRRGLTHGDVGAGAIRGTNLASR